MWIVLITYRPETNHRPREFTVDTLDHLAKHVTDGPPVGDIEGINITLTTE